MTREQLEELAVIEQADFMLDAWLGADLFRRIDALDSEIMAAFEALDHVWQPTPDQIEDVETLRDLDTEPEPELDEDEEWQHEQQVSAYYMGAW